MCKISQGHDSEDQSVAPKDFRNDGSIEFMKDLSDQLVGFFHGFGTEPYAGKSDENKGVEDFPESNGPVSALFIGGDPFPELIDHQSHSIQSASYHELPAGSVP